MTTAQERDPEILILKHECGIKIRFRKLKVGEKFRNGDFYLSCGELNLLSGLKWYSRKKITKTGFATHYRLF
jgi:hypothetical protein